MDILTVIVLIIIAFGFGILVGRSRDEIVSGIRRSLCNGMER